MIFKLEAREMSEKAQYRTRQITELENYLCSMEGKHVTVSDICKYSVSYTHLTLPTICSV